MQNIFLRTGVTRTINAALEKLLVDDFIIQWLEEFDRS